METCGHILGVWGRCLPVCPWELEVAKPIPHAREEELGRAHFAGPNMALKVTGWVVDRAMGQEAGIGVL
jgi:hypothetical protein